MNLPDDGISSHHEVIGHHIIMHIHHTRFEKFRLRLYFKELIRSNAQSVHIARTLPGLKCVAQMLRKRAEIMRMA